MIITPLYLELKKLNERQRARLCAAAGLGQSTLYRRLDRPGTFTIAELEGIKGFLDKLLKADFDMRHMTKPLTVAPRAGRKRRAA